MLLHSVLEPRGDAWLAVHVSLNHQCEEGTMRPLISINKEDHGQGGPRTVVEEVDMQFM